MPFYAFRLDNINVKYQRGKLQDEDIVTFGAFINQVDRGHGAALFHDLSSGSNIPAGAVPPHTALCITPQWIVGPFEIAPGDGVSIVYSGTNTSDWQLGTSAGQQQDQIEIKILDTIATAVVGATGFGAIVAAVGGALGYATDLIGKLLGFRAQGPCNGLVFSDAVEFTGSGLAALPFAPASSPQHVYESWPNSLEFSFTRSYTDEATHDTSICGHIAETDVLFSVLQIASVSVKYYMAMFFRSKSLSNGLRQCAPAPNSAFSLRKLMSLRA